MHDAKAYRALIRATPDAKARAKQLRANLTEPERMLLWAIRSARPSGIKFRIQEPLGPYIADMYCHLARLVIEIDGKEHRGDKLRRDRVRDEWMRVRGIEVIRINASEVYANLDGVLSTMMCKAKQRIEYIRY